MIRIKDIADRAGVSPTTVSNVIHGKTGRVSKATVEKINRILKEMEYVPSISARMLANNSSGLIGVALGFMKKGNASSFEDRSRAHCTAILRLALNTYMCRKVFSI